MDKTNKDNFIDCSLVILICSITCSFITLASKSINREQVKHCGSII